MSLMHLECKLNAFNRLQRFLKNISQLENYIKVYPYKYTDQVTTDMLISKMNKDLCIKIVYILHIRIDSVI